MPETSRDTEVKETNQSGFDPTRVKSLLNVDERGKGVLMAAEAQRVHKAGGYPPWEGSSCGRMVGRTASVNEVLEKFESAGCERNGRNESREVGSPSRLLNGTTKLDFQEDGNTARRRTRLKKESRR